MRACGHVALAGITQAKPAMECKLGAPVTGVAAAKSLMAASPAEEGMVMGQGPFGLKYYLSGAIAGGCVSACRLTIQLIQQQGCFASAWNMDRTCDPPAIAMSARWNVQLNTHIQCSYVEPARRVRAHEPPAIALNSSCHHAAFSQTACSRFSHSPVITESAVVSRTARSHRLTS